MQNKICIVTGANSGIGKVTALELAKKDKNNTIIMVCRNAEKAQKALQEIKLQSKNENIDLFLADFSSQSQIRRVSQEILAKYAQIDVLVNNAGFIAKSTREISEDGLELTFATNHLGYFMFTNLLKDALKVGRDARIINVSSEAHRFIRADLNNLQLEKGYSSIKAYALSKLLNIHFTRELARRLNEAKLDISANCLHPGAVATNFASDSNPIFKFIFKFGKPFLLSAEQGAETSIYLASSPLIEGVTGEYFDKKRIKTPSSDALSDEKARKIWEISTQLTKMEGKTF